MRHRHVNKLGFFSKAGNALEWYSNGVLTLSRSGSVSYHCVFAPSPNVCEPDIVLTPDEIREIKISSEGLLHLATTQGNYDFGGDGSSIAEIRNELTAAKHNQ